MGESTKEVIHERKWLALRSGTIKEVTEPSGRITYRVKIWDDEREPFITQTFNDEGTALSFLERVMEENGHFVKRYEKELAHD